MSFQPVDSWLSNLYDPLPDTLSCGDYNPTPTESLDVCVGTPQGSQGIADSDGCSPTDLLESADSVGHHTTRFKLTGRFSQTDHPSLSHEGLEAEQRKSAHRFESTVCLWPGDHDGFIELQPELLDPSTFSFRPASKPPQGSPAWERRPSKSGNRATGTSDGEVLESGGGWGGKEVRRDSWSEPKLNCPFYLKDPYKNHECSRSHFRDWDEFQSHLSRRHQKPLYCNICGVVFLEETARDEHIHQGKCSRATFEEPSGITEEQEIAIRSLTPRDRKSLAFDDLWLKGLKGWKILFPDTPYPLSPICIQRRPQDDVSDATEADFRLLASRDFRSWIQSFPSMSGEGENRRAEACKELIKTFTWWLPGQDSQWPQVSQRKDGTSQGARFKPSAAIQGEPSEFPQNLEFPGDASARNPSTSSVGTSPDAHTEPPLFISIRRILSADPIYPAEDVIAAIKERSGGQSFALPGSGSEPAIIDDPTSEAPAGQEPTARGTKKRATRTSDRSKSSANKKQKTRTPSNANGLNENNSGGNGDDVDGEGSDGDSEDSDPDGDDGDSTPPDHTSDDFEGWACPYCLKYVEITCVKGFKACGRPGFSKRCDLRTHLRRIHFENRPENLEESLTQYYMSKEQWEKVEKVMDTNKERPQKKKDPQGWLRVQRTWYHDVWAELFPLSQYVPDSPFHTSNEQLKQRCHQVVEAMMDLERERAQAQYRSSCDDTQLFTRVQVQNMLNKALHIGLNSLPIAAQHFGPREAVQETRTEPQISATATATEDEATGPTFDGSVGIIAITQAAAAETEGSSTPENTLPMIPKEVTPQTGPTQIALNSHQDVLLANDGQRTYINIEFKPRNPFETTALPPVAQVQVTAPSQFSVHIAEPAYEWILDDFNFGL